MSRPNPHPVVPSSSFADADVQSMLGQLRLSLGPLETDQAVVRRDVENSSEHINDLRDSMHDQEERQSGALDEVQSALDSLIEGDLFDHITRQVKHEIALQIDEEVTRQVAELLKTHIPSDLQDEVAEQKQQLEHWRCQLHNSESRRANSAISDPSSTIQPLLMPNGQPSTVFPNTLKDLLELDSEDVKQLMGDYSIPQPFEDSETAELNTVLQFFGTTFYKRTARY